MSTRHFGIRREETVAAAEIIVREAYDGSGHIEQFETDVNDGFLDIRLLPIIDVPGVSGISIERL